MPSMPLDALVIIMIVFFVILFFTIIVVLRFSIKTVPENKRVVLFRLGRSLGSRGPGLVLLIPVIDHVVWVDLDKNYQHEFGDLLTADGRKISCRITLQGKVIDPEKSVLEVHDLENALFQVIATVLRSAVGSRKYDEFIDLRRLDLINLRDWMEEQLKAVLYETSRAWGFEVVVLAVDVVDRPAGLDVEPG